jgi:hypothetical protein
VELFHPGGQPFVAVLHGEFAPKSGADFSREFRANFAQQLRNAAPFFEPSKLCLGKMSDGIFGS